MKKFQLLSVSLIVTTLGVALSGCTYEEANNRLQAALNDLMGKSAQKKQATPAPSPVSDQDRLLKENVEILHEIYQVVLLREPYGPEEFGTFVNMLAQGASLEGIYNGLVNSEYYRNLEEKSPPAEAATIRAFSEMMPGFEKDLAGTKVRPTDFGFPPPYIPEKFEVAFRSASLFKLKRVLGAEALKVVEAKTGDGKKLDDLAQWYSAWAARMATRGVDFGLPLRNKADADFHKRWLLGLPPAIESDRVDWEVLNRVDRILNTTEAKARSAAAT